MFGKTKHIRVNMIYSIQFNDLAAGCLLCFTKHFQTDTLPLAVDTWLPQTARTEIFHCTLCFPNLYCHMRAVMGNEAPKEEEVMNSWHQKSMCWTYSLDSAKEISIFFPPSRRHFPNSAGQNAILSLFPLSNTAVVGIF